MFIILKSIYKHSEKEAEMYVNYKNVYRIFKVKLFKLIH